MDLDEEPDAGADYDGPGSKAIVLDPKGNISFRAGLIHAATRRGSGQAQLS